VFLIGQAQTFSIEKNRRPTGGACGISSFRVVKATRMRARRKRAACYVQATAENPNPSVTNAMIKQLLIRLAIH
jgi:hypothetical protein